MISWWVCGGESGLPILFLCHLRTAPQGSLFFAAQTSHCSGLSCCQVWTLEWEGFLVVVHRFSCSEACGIVLDQGLNTCLLHSQPLGHQGSHETSLLNPALPLPVRGNPFCDFWLFIYFWLFFIVLSAINVIWYSFPPPFELYISGIITSLYLAYFTSFIYETHLCWCG